MKAKQFKLPSEMSYAELEKELKEIQAFLQEETSAFGRQELQWEQVIIKELDKRDNHDCHTSPEDGCDENCPETK